MSVSICPGCSRPISISAIPGGNPVAKSDSDGWVDSQICRYCKNCGLLVCPRCAPTSGSKCPQCSGPLLVQTGIDVKVTKRADNVGATLVTYNRHDVSSVIRSCSDSSPPEILFAVWIYARRTESTKDLEKLLRPFAQDVREKLIVTGKERLESLDPEGLGFFYSYRPPTTEEDYDSEFFIPKSFVEMLANGHDTD